MRFLAAIVFLLGVAESMAQPVGVAPGDGPPGDGLHSADSAAAGVDSLDAIRLAIVAGATTGAFVYGHVLQQNMWWKGERSAFHFEWRHDWEYSLGADKLGHAWFPYAVTHLYDRLLRWSRVDPTTSIWSAASLALAYQSYIEVRDGFSADWGFSWGDFTADVLGAALPVAQHYAPPLRSVELKMSFFPSESFRSGAHRAIIDDYESTYHWLSLHVAQTLPHAWRRYYPSFIDLALGHGVKGLDGNGGGRHEIFLSLDWNTDALPGDAWPLEVLRTVLRSYHLPAPAVRLYPAPITVGIHF